MTLPPIWPDSAAATWAALSAIFTALAFIAAAIYAYLTSQIRDRDQRPLLRLVRLPDTEQGFVVKNIGRGPAVGVSLTDHSGRVLYFLDAVEPLGLGVGSEAQRTGRAAFHTPEAIPRLPGFPFFLVYQDVGGRWFVTKLVPDGDHFKTQFIRIRWPRVVPVAVRERTQVVSAFEDLGGAQAFASSWDRHKAWVRASLQDGSDQTPD